MPTANWADYPTLGFDEQAIYIAVNMFTFNGPFQYTKLRILNKSEVYAAPGLAAPALRWYDITVILNPDAPHGLLRCSPRSIIVRARPRVLRERAVAERQRAHRVDADEPARRVERPARRARVRAGFVACQSYDCRRLRSSPAAGRRS